LIFDTDVDRAAAVDSKGREIARNRIVALAATFAKEKSPGTTVVTDSVTSTQLHDFIENQLGLTHHRFKRGYRNVINESIRLNESGIDSQLAIETSGHGAFKDNYFLDDGAYLATLITIKATLLKREGKEISHILDSLEDPLEALEIRLPISQDDFQSYGDEVLDALEKWVRSINDQDIQLELPNYEGVRVKLSGKYGEGWFLLRKSLHDPLLPLNIESNEAGGTNKIRALLRPFFSNFQSLDTSNL
jgi:phosphomannomutase